jgi:hypothetical protein
MISDIVLSITSLNLNGDITDDILSVNIIYRGCKLLSFVHNSS